MKKINNALLEKENVLLTTQTLKEAGEKAAQDILNALLTENNDTNEKIKSQTKELSYSARKNEVNVLLQAKLTLEKNEGITSDLKKEAVHSVNEQLKELWYQN